MNQAVNIIEFKGFSKSGKTESILSLIRYLKENNYTISSLKHIHIDNFSLDTPGKNTWKMAEAGSQPIVAVSNNETSFIIKKHLSLKSIISIIKYISEVTLKDKIIKETKNEGLRDKACGFIEHTSNVDFILAEGYYDGDFPLVICLKSIEDIDNLLELIFKKDDSVKIINSICCFSGSLLENIEYGNKGNTIKNIKNEIEKNIVLFFKKKNEIDSNRLIEHLINVPLINIKKNPSKFLELYEILSFSKKKTILKI